MMASRSISPHEGVTYQASDLTFSSPKRKRDENDKGRTESPVRLRTDLPSRPLIRNTEGSSDPTSPRTKVSNQLRTLKLDIDFSASAPVLDFGKPAKADQSTHAPTSIALELDGSTETIDQNLTDSDSHVIPIPEAHFALPQAAIVEPTDLSQGATQVASQFPSPTSQTQHGIVSDSLGLKSKTKTVRASRTRSPPPSTSPAHSDLVWTAAEITGHNPTDPADDGTGINGIGFRPTPAMAQARAQKRRQQVAEWKSREAKEARQRRLDRRKGLEQSLSTGLEHVEQAPRRVRFVEG